MKYIPTVAIFFLLTHIQAQSVKSDLVVTDSISVVSSFSPVYHFLYAPQMEGNHFLMKNKSSSSVLFNYKPAHLPGLFCKMEYNIEQKSKLPLRFRLGSLNYTEWMEGKGELYNRYAP